MQPVIHIGFTGTQDGMTEAQRRSVEIILRYKEFVGHHGDCVGADAEFHDIARACRGLLWMHIHPPLNQAKRAFCRIDPARDVLERERPNLDRNREIVTQAEIMVATPKQPGPVPRSGTWTTVRYARELGRPLAVVIPNGAIITENGFTWGLDR